MTRPNLKRPGPTARAILAYVKAYKTESGGDSPTIGEIVGAVGLSSKSTVHLHLRTLERFGLIERDKAKVSRRIRVIGGEWRFREESQ